MKSYIFCGKIIVTNYAFLRLRRINIDADRCETDLAMLTCTHSTYPQPGRHIHPEVTCMIRQHAISGDLRRSEAARNYKM